MLIEQPMAITMQEIAETFLRERLDINQRLGRVDHSWVVRGVNLITDGHELTVIMKMANSQGVRSYAGSCTAKKVKKESTLASRFESVLESLLIDFLEEATVPEWAG